MRLIDADAIIPKGTRITPDNVDVATAIRFAPTVAAVPVVRCRECKKHCEANGEHYCKFWGMYCPDDSDFFCKAGERKEGAYHA